MSLSARRAWIEIRCRSRRLLLSRVALRKESVDRNSCWGTAVMAFLSVALRKESVDRNTVPMGSMDHGPQSLSARRAWIEIKLISNVRPPLGVALRKESVDRNCVNAKSRTASPVVALRKESVDRNDIETSRVCTDAGRSPQGERG